MDGQALCLCCIFSPSSTSLSTTVEQGGPTNERSINRDKLTRQWIPQIALPPAMTAGLSKVLGEVIPLLDLRIHTEEEIKERPDDLLTQSSERHVQRECMHKKRKAKDYNVL